MIARNISENLNKQSYAECVVNTAPFPGGVERNEKLEYINSENLFHFHMVSDVSQHIHCQLSEMQSN